MSATKATHCCQMPPKLIKWPHLGTQLQNNLHGRASVGTCTLQIPHSTTRRQQFSLVQKLTESKASPLISSRFYFFTSPEKLINIKILST